MIFLKKRTVLNFILVILILNITLFGLDCVDINRLLVAIEISSLELEFDDIKILTSQSSDRKKIVKIDEVKSINEYNQFIIKRLNNHINTDFVLIIQHDGFVLNPKAWTGDYLNYDYIGAPWWEKGKFIVGNGGFSLRSKKLLNLLQSDDVIQIPNDEPEDWFICVTMRHYLEGKGIKFAPVPLAKKFSLEGNEKLGIKWADQFGFHGLHWTDISTWLKRHPKYQIDNTLDEWSLDVEKKLSRPVK